MKLTPTIVVEIGALIGVSGALMMVRIELSADQVAFLRALTAIIIGFFFIQVGYAQSLRERIEIKLMKQPPRPDNPE
jgi:hypothetical protein